MKDLIQRVEIEPENCYLEYMGPCKPDEPGQALRGRVRVTVAKTLKIRSMVVKFKGFCHVCLNHAAGADAMETEISFLPKIKVSLLDNKTTTLSPGEHTIPWQLEVPNVFPRSLMIKRASIYYKVEVSISTGLRKKAITADHPIVLLRHLLPRKELASLIGTKTFRYTVTGKFHYEIECPQVVCLEQNVIPIAIKYICIADQKDVKSICTQVLQNELYRCENLSKSESNLEQFGKDSKSAIFGQRFVDYFNGNPKCRRITRRKGSMFVHHIGNNPESPWKLPTLVYHNLDEHLTFGLESPLVTVYHQLEVTFNFGSKYNNIRAKIPIIFTSLPNRSQTEQDDDLDDRPMSRYSIETIPHHAPDNVTIDPEKSKNVAAASVKLTDDDASTHPKDPISKEQEIFTGVVTSSTKTAARFSRAPHSVSTGLSSLDISKDQAPSPSLSAFGDLPRSLRRSASASNFHVPRAPDANTSPPRRPPRSPARPLATAAPLTINTVVNKEAVRAPLSDDNFTVLTSRSIASSEALPMIDRDAMNARLRDSKLYSVYSGSSSLGPSHRVAPWLQMLCEEYDNDYTDEERAGEDNGYYDQEDGDGDDEMSLYSDASMSSRDAASLGSTTTGSSSHVSLKSRPPSLVPSPVAPGLPAATTLRPQSTETSLIEESFPPTNMSILSDPNTEASSHVLTPRTSLALHRQRMALERIPPPPPLPPPSTLPPKLPTKVAKRSNVQVSRSRSPSMPINTEHDYPQEVQKHYSEAELPPVPSEDTRPNKTVCYFYDSDEEQEILDRLVPQATSTVTLPDKLLFSAQERIESPPQLPRLSLGSTFSASLNIDQKE